MEYKPNPYFHPSASASVQLNDDPQVQELEKYPEEELQHITVAGMTSIIIPAYFLTYPLWHQTGNCIGSIREHTDKTKTPYEIILVINGETGIGFAEDKLKDTYCDKVIQNPENLGYAKAVNKGIRVAEGEFIAIMNNDVQVYEHWLEDMQEALQHLALVMATPMYGMPFARAVESKKLRDETFGKRIEETFSDFNDFSCVLTTKALFDEIGLFDEQFFMYGEDLDLIKRIEKIGKKKASTKRVNTHHIISSTASGINETPEWMNTARELLKKKWGE
jgi:O-antigen biosynthesis protein